MAQTDRVCDGVAQEDTMLNPNIHIIGLRSVGEESYMNQLV